MDMPPGARKLSETARMSNRSIKRLCKKDGGLSTPKQSALVFFFTPIPAKRDLIVNRQTTDRFPNQANVSLFYEKTIFK